MMKKNIIILLLALFCLTGCGNAEEENAKTSEAASSTEAATDNMSSDAASAESTPGASDTTQVPTSDADTASGSTANYRLSIPEGFTAIEAEGMEFYYVHEDSSSVSMNVQDKDPGFSTLTAGVLSEALINTFSQTYDLDVTITDLYFSTENVSGFSGYQYCFSYTLEETPVTQLVVSVDAGQTYTFTYTDMSGSWIQVFEQSAKTIQITE